MPNQQQYTTPGSYTFNVPIGVTLITVKCWGAGRSGSDGSYESAGGSGGDGGDYAEGVIAVTPESTIPVEVGAGGSGNLSAGGPSGVGSDPSVVVAKGGGHWLPSIGDVIYPGGLGASGSIDFPTFWGGGGGGGGGTTASGYPGSGTNGGAGGYEDGGQGGGGSPGDGGGSPGYAYGGGGGGGGGNGSGWPSGYGGDGKVVIEWDDPPSAPVAAFSATPLTGTAPLSVAFTEASTNTPTSWLWEKSDDAGASWSNFASGAATQHPTEEFTSGTWSIRLTATNAGGNDSETKIDYITIGATSSPPPSVARRAYQRVRFHG